MTTLGYQQIRGPLKPCLLSTLIHFVHEFVILKDTLNRMGRFYMLEFGGTLHLYNLKLRKMQLKLLNVHT